MAFVKLALVFVIIIALLAYKWPLWQAILGGLAATAVFLSASPSGHGTPDRKGRYRLVVHFRAAVAVSHHLFAARSFQRKFSANHAKSAYFQRKLSLSSFYTLTSSIGNMPSLHI